MFQLRQGIGDNLEYLDASTSQLGNLSCLETASYLQIALFKNSRLTDTNGLKKTKRLLYLDISENRLTDTNMVSLAPAAALKYLNASENLFYTLPEFENVMLQELNMSNNLLQTVRFGTFLGHLRILNLSDNQITEIRPLCMIPFLTNLNVSNNQLSELSSLYSIAVCQSLEILEISGNAFLKDARLGIALPTIFKKLKVSKFNTDSE